MRGRRAPTRTAGCLAALLLTATACVTGQREPPPPGKFWCPDGGWENGGLHCHTDERWCKDLVYGMRLMLQWKNECVPTDTVWCFRWEDIPDRTKRVGMQCYPTRETCSVPFHVRGVESQCFVFRDVRVYEGHRVRD